MALQENTFNPVTQNPNTNIYVAGAPGSPYTVSTSGTQTLLLANEIDKQIIESFPSMFTDVAFMMSQPSITTGALNFNWPEEPYLVAPLVGGTGGAGGASPQVYNITSGTTGYVGLNDKVLFANGQSGVVTAISGQNVTVTSYNGDALPAVAAGELIANRGPATADGVSDILTTFRPQIAGFNNILEDVGPVAVRFDPKEMRQWELTGTTDYIQKTMSSAYKRFLVGMHQTIWMSQYGTTTLTNGQPATATSGILEQQANSGVPNQPCTPATFVDVMRNTIFDTALTGESTRVVFATRRVLNIIGTAQKAEKIRYRPEDKSWNLDIYEYEFYGHKLLLVPMDQWEDTGSYGTIMRNQVVMLNKSDIALRHMDGFPMIAQKYELMNRINANPGNLYNFKLVYWEGNVAPQVKRAWATGRFTVNGI